MSLSDADALNTALSQYLGWTGDPVATLSAAVERNPAFILGHTTIAALNSLGGVPGNAAPVRNALAAAEEFAAQATARERLHLQAAQAWAAGEIENAASAWEAALAADPRDLLALRLVHDTHFYLGASQKLRDVPLSVLPAFEGTKERGFVLGMAAFGLEEMGDYAAAEQAGREAVEMNPADSWAVHAVAHVLEMQDRAAEGIAWMRGLEAHWVPASGLAVHQWWHTGLFLIECDRLDEALALYDENLRGTESAMILDLVDAAALLWRLELLGVDVGGRWRRLAPLWEDYVEDHVLAFNDVHIAMTFAGAGESEALDRLEQSLEEYAARETGTNAQVSRRLGIPLIGALRAFREGDETACVRRLTPIYRELAPVGGSNAQRDVFIQTLGIAAWRLEDAELAQAVAAERMKLKIGRPRAWAGFI